MRRYFVVSIRRRPDGSFRLFEVAAGDSDCSMHSEGLVRSRGDASGTRYSFTSRQTAELQGGRYTLCWCAGIRTSCEARRDFSFLLGTLEVVGPLSMQRFSCTRGRTCELVLAGVGLATGDSVSLSTRCGEAFLADVETDGSAASFGAEALPSRPGFYAVCWCRGCEDDVRTHAGEVWSETAEDLARGDSSRKRVHASKGQLVSRRLRQSA